MTEKNQSRESESGYITAIDTDISLVSEMHDVEILLISKTNVIARGRRYGRQWFLKGLREELRDSAAMQRQLLKEFEIHSRLHHPSVVQVIGMEYVSGLGLCIVQEWVDGITLQEVLDKQKIKTSERRRMIRDLTKAVAYLHSRGVVHRDLKPSNVMIRDIGKEVTVIDFGLADTSDYVEIKGAAGTPGFISPEQMKSGGADPADDVYSLGVIMKLMASSAYSSIARRCIAPEGRRPADAGHLLKMIRSQDRLPKIIAGIAVAIVAIAGFAVVALHIHKLEQSAYDSAGKVTVLKNENNENLSRIASLNDSLSMLKGNLDDANDRLNGISEYENLKKSVFQEGCRRIDDILIRADRNIFSKIPQDDVFSYNDNLFRISEKLKTAVEAHLQSCLQSASVSGGDIDNIRTSLYTYEGVKLSEYQEKWQKRTNSLKTEDM